MRLIFIALLVITTTFAHAQSADTLTKKNTRFSILGGPGYTPDYGFLIGGSALLTFSTNTSDTLLKRSVIPIAFAYMTKGGGSVIIKPQLFFNSDRFRIFGQISMNKTLDNYYGVGFQTNTNRERGPDSTEYRSIGFKINPQFMFRYKSTDLFYGVSLDLSQKNMTDPSEGILKDKDYQAHASDSTELNYLNIGIGANFSYDTRDVPANSYKGMLLELGITYYSKSIGSSTDFGVVNLQYRQFKELGFIGKRKVLAWMISARSSFGDIPLTDLSTIGSPYDLRGYYMGQYRDKNALTSLLEYRHMFNMGDQTKFRKIASKFGFATWAGLGAINAGFDSPESGTLPNYGGGLRIELQPRMNFRVDVGHDPINDQTLLYFNMTEAF